MSIRRRSVAVTMCILILASLISFVLPIPRTVSAAFKIEGEEKYTITINNETVFVGKGGTTFIPEITLYRWDDECWIKLGEPLINGAPLNQKDSTSTMDGDIINWASKDIQFEFYSTGDAFEYEMTIANSKAGTTSLLSSITFPIQSQGLSFYYQPPLTEEYSSGWSDRFQVNITVNETTVANNKTGDVLIYRPENVVGSYAVYHESKNGDYTALGGKNYMAGKAFHIYRPMLVDNTGAIAYANLSIIVDGKGTGYITYDYTGIGGWLNKAKYPVNHVIGETFGYITKGVSTANWYNDYITGCLFTLSEAGTGVSINWYIQEFAGQAPIKFALYDSSGNFVTNGDTAEWTITTSYDDWKALNFNTGPSLSAQNYYICFWCDTYHFYGKYDSGAAGQTQYDAQTYGSWPATVSWDGGLAYKCSAYCTYTPGGGCTPAITNSPDNFGFGTLEVSETSATGLDYFTITNTGACAVDITIKGTDMTGGGETWTLSDAGTAGDGIYALKAGLDGGSYSIVVKKNSPYNELVNNLGSSSTQDWGMTLYAPTANIKNEAMSGTVILTATEHT